MHIHEAADAHNDDLPMGLGLRHRVPIRPSARILRASNTRLLIVRNKLTAAVNLNRSAPRHASPQIEYGSLDSSGQLLLTRKVAKQNVTKADFAELTDRLHRIESLLRRTR